MRQFAAVTALIILSPWPLSPSERVRLMIWNVGQGQWLTEVRGEWCRHFDLGGEFAPWRKVDENCRLRKNAVFLSHWDHDHIGFLFRARNLWPRVCLALGPAGAATRRKQRILQGMENCPASAWSPVRQIFDGRYFAKHRLINQRSHVLTLGGTILIPGDAPAASEKLWWRDSRLHHVQVLILGHHGSRTSTSKNLLAALPNLKLAIASARHARYGHPHHQVIERLKGRTALLRTEDWGTIELEQD